jgi:hypothetical protein
MRVAFLARRMKQLRTTDGDCFPTVDRELLASVSGGGLDHDPSVLPKHASPAEADRYYRENTDGPTTWGMSLSNAWGRIRGQQPTYTNDPFAKTWFGGIFH